MTSKTGLPYHSGADLTLFYLRDSVVTWSEVTWSSSLASSLIGVVVTRTDFCDELLSNKVEGTITLSSFLLSSHLLLSRETPSLERIHYKQRMSCLRICDRRCTQQSPLGILWRHISPIWVWAYQDETFSHKHRNPKLQETTTLVSCQTIVHKASSRRI
mgnify:CR=1 FL=1